MTDAIKLSEEMVGVLYRAKYFYLLGRKLMKYLTEDITENLGSSL